MAGVLLWGWYNTGKEWVKLQVDEDGYVLVDLSEISLDDLADVTFGALADGQFISYSLGLETWQNRLLSEGDIPDEIARDTEVATAVSDHANLTTAVHGVGAGTIGSVSTANKTIYVDKAATGADDGTSWADAFTTIQDAVDSLDDIILHAYTIIVRKGATPYREQVELNSLPASYPSHLILGSLTIEAEYYWYGTCEANVGGAGEITDTAAFADVLVGDKVYILDRNGANNRAQDYELCTVDDIANIPNRIGTDGTKTPTTLWQYVIVRTEISGSDDGTDVGTVRDHCFLLNTIDKVVINGFYFTFSDHFAIRAFNSRSIEVNKSIFEDCDFGVNSRENSSVKSYYCYVGTSDGWTYYSGRLAYLEAFYVALHCGAAVYSVGSTEVSYLYMTYFVIDIGARGVHLADLSVAVIQLGTITNGVTLGIIARNNSTIRTINTTNSAVTPVDPVGTVEGAYIA